MVDKTQFRGEVIGKPKKQLSPGYKLNPTPEQIFSNMTFHYFDTEGDMDKFVAKRLSTTNDKVHPGKRPDGTFSVCVYER